MKNFALLVLFALAIVSCGDDIESNTPSIQGEFNGNFFRSNSSVAYLNSDGSVTLTGEPGLDVITLKASALEVGSYELGEGAQNEAGYEVDGMVTYSTGTTGDGLIQITRIEENALSGEFYFDAINGDTITVSKGSFFSVPLTNGNAGGSGGNQLECAEATLATGLALQAYDAADANDPSFNQLCLDYQTALEAQIEACGDPDGAFQAELDQLSCVEE